MNKIVFFLIALLITFSSFADTYVKGHYRKSGTYVKPHYRSSSNGTKRDNWSTKGNTNPYTGKRGTKTNDNLNYYNSGKKSKSKSQYGW